MKLYGYWRSSSTWRVRIVLAHKGVAYETKPVHLLKDGGEQRADTYAAVNPMQQVPVLELEDGRRLSQSMAIVEYLEDAYSERPLLPRDHYMRARARQYAEVVNSGIQPLQNLRVMMDLKERGLDGKAWSAKWIANGLSALEMMSAETRGTYLVGDEVSLADVLLIPQLYNARRFELPISESLLAIERACFELDAFKASHPDQQPDAVA